MAQHISRKELKTDEVHAALEQGWQALLSHEKFTIGVLILAIVVVAGVYGWRWYSESQASHAETDFTAAMDIFQAPVGPPQTPGQLTYTDENRKFTEAGQAFAKVAKNYGRTRSGQLAAYYAALSDEKLKNDAAAEKWLDGIKGSKDAEVASIAKFELAGLYALDGKTDQAIPIYQALMAQPTILVPKPEAMLALANCYRAKDPAQAAKLYGQIKTDYPDTPIADQADEALALLPAASKS
ncbi:MAG: tetratricopeptide repeat protein [Acidobacteriota bacterium]|nr:tetratricopeptide repeat protein [Acidobacteriota bacterium]